MRARLDAWVPDPDERAIILASTPARLYGFDGASLGRGPTEAPG